MLKEKAAISNINEGIEKSIFFIWLLFMYVKIDSFEDIDEKFW